MITVLTIIILVLAIAIPVWNALMGGTNVAAAQNQISAFLANARADAIYNRRSIGVCFFVDPKTRQTAMAEVQIQSEWTSPTSSTSLLTPNVVNPATNLPVITNGTANALELVNNPDPNSPGNFLFYRDVSLLPAGVGVALNNNTYTYNQAVTPTGNYYLSYRSNPNNLPPIDRYVRLGVIMFGPDGTLVSIPFEIPFNDTMSSTTPPSGTNNLLCKQIGMVYSGTLWDDVGSTVNGTTATPTARQLPLMSSVGLVVFDHDAYLAQHASMTVNSRGVPTNIGSGAQFTDYDMDYTLYNNLNSPSTPSYQPRFDDKFIEENWIDQNGIALMINPSNGSLIRAK